MFHRYYITEIVQNIGSNLVQTKENENEKYRQVIIIECKSSYFFDSQFYTL